MSKKKPSKETPVVTEKAIALRKTSLGWSVVEFQIADGEVVSEKVSEPDMRAMALEKFRRLTFYMQGSDQ
jgi:hypothetical protein